MKSDARLLLNKKKWSKASRNQKRDNWKSHGTVDARKILNIKRSQKFKTPVIGSYMRINTAADLIDHIIKKNISTLPQVPAKRVQLSKDGNIIVTSKSQNASRDSVSRFTTYESGRNCVPGAKFSSNHNDSVSRFTSYLSGRNHVPDLKFSSNSNMHWRNETSPSTNLPLRNRLLESNVHEPSASDMYDLEHTAIEDVLDLESLPTAFVSPNTIQNANLSRKSVVGQVLDKRHTMVADQLSQPSSSSTNGFKVYVSNLSLTVSRQDVVELFGDVGIIKSADMLKPGTAIIDFYNELDASKACDIYHNRLLDGLPMKCYMENDSLSAISQRLGSRMAQQVPDFHMPVSSVMSSNPRSRYNPRNVQFTVKLT